jgi:hypothetical protein
VENPLAGMLKIKEGFDPAEAHGLLVGIGF